jgi:hypothetical protein
MAKSIPSSDYASFLDRKTQLDGDHGFAATLVPDYLFDFQRAMVEWSVRKGRAALLQDCGLGKTIQELIWAQNVSNHTDKPVLILTPLAVAQQIVREGEKFGIEATRSHRGEIASRIVVANYERLHLFNPADFAGVVCDESSVLKSFEGETRKAITDFMRKLPYRLLATATAAPNDYVELGTSSEALGYLGYMDMLGRFFTNNNNGARGYRNQAWDQVEWRFKGHAEQAFWRWVSSWARALRRPSDLGFDDTGFDLPPPTIRNHVVKATTAPDGMLFDIGARGFREEREVRRRTITERCEMTASLVNDTGQPAVVWCHLNPEGDLLEKLIPDAIQVSGRDSDDEKEAKLIDFCEGRTRVLVSKPVIGAWGLNLQHCNHLTFFPSHSYEQWYQAVRRCWRFGQTRPVTVDVVATEGEIEVQQNLQRKAQQAERMFTELVAHMSDAMAIRRSDPFDKMMEVPAWLAS